jgi:hypothetical protein
VPTCAGVRRGRWDYVGLGTASRSLFRRKLGASLNTSLVHLYQHYVLPLVWWLRQVGLRQVDGVRPSFGIGARDQLVADEAAVIEIFEDLSSYSLALGATWLSVWQQLHAFFRQNIKSVLVAVVDLLPKILPEVTATRLSHAVSVYWRLNATCGRGE